MRVLGVDFGMRRIGLALSDATATLARPWQTIPAGATPAASAARVAELLLRWSNLDDEPPAAIVVGLPRKLDGRDTDQTAPAREFAAALETLTTRAVHLQDERLTSREAESRLALREKDWRKRKALLDAASAAILLQDYLDARAAALTRAEPC